MIEYDKILVSSVSFPYTITIYNSSNASLSETKFKQIDFTKIDKFKNADFTSTDRVYFCKSSVTPRYKIKDYCIKNNITLNKTNKINYADTFIINYEDIKEIKNLKFYVDYKSIPIDGINITLDKNVDEDYKKATHCCIPISNYHNDSNMIKTYGKKSYEALPTIKLSKVSNKYANLLEILEVFFSDPSKYKLVFDQTISGKINDFELDIATFDTLYNMFSSTNENDVQLGTEILSNCDRVKNKVAVLLLLSKFWGKIGHRTNTNFKSLTEHFKNYGESNKNLRRVYLGDNSLSFLQYILETETIVDEDKQVINQYLKYYFREHISHNLKNRLIIDEFKTTFI